MVVQFCEDCGYLLAASAATEITCELCGKVATSMSPIAALNNLLSELISRTS